MKTMNWTILKSKISQTAKLVWHVIRDGISSPIEIGRRIDRDRSAVVRAIAELKSENLVINIYYGCYQVLGDAETHQSDAMTHRSEAETHQSKTDRCKNASVESDAKTHQTDTMTHRSEVKMRQTDGK